MKTLLIDLENGYKSIGSKETIEDKMNSDKILNNKVNFIKLNLAKIDKNIL